MYILILVIFVLGYLAIALEHPLHLDKTASALFIGAGTWAIFALAPADVLNLDSSKSIQEIYVESQQPNSEVKISEDLSKYMEEEINSDHHAEVHPSQDPAETNSILNHFVVHELSHHIAHIAEILFFLLGAMTIVELIDAHEGFAVITDKIKTTDKVKLLWILSLITFFFSAALDNLTTSIVMVSLLRKLIEDKKDRWMFAGIIVVAANAGGAWSPIGDVTTTMLWIGNQITVNNVVVHLIVPSLICILVPLAVLSFRMKGNVTRPVKQEGVGHYINPTTKSERNLVFFLGVALLLFVPVFKSVTHLPPYMGMLLGLGILSGVTEIIHRSKKHEEKNALSILGVLKKIDTASVLFFLGILVAVSSLQVAGHLVELAGFLKESFENVYAINIAIGLLSSIVDNVPLVAASQGMYDVFDPALVSTLSDWDKNFVTDGTFWEFLAYCAGTGGSALIIGSAAGVAVMGLERIDFIWYLKNISLLAVLGYLAGAVYYILVY